MFIQLKFDAEISVPMFAHGLCAGFPSPADDFLDEAIDLNDLAFSDRAASALTENAGPREHVDVFCGSIALRSFCDERRGCRNRHALRLRPERRLRGYSS